MSDLSKPGRRARILSLFGAGVDKRRLRALAFGLFGAALIWQIVATNLAIHLIEIAPRAALFLAPRNPTVLLELAERKVNPKPASRDVAEEADKTADPSVGDRDQESAATGDEPADGVTTDAAEESGGHSIDAAGKEQARAWAETALALSPLDARALRLLGQLAPEQAATSFMEAAARRSLNETRAHLWLLRDRFDRGRYVEALRSADLILRTRPQLLAAVTPFLARMAEDRIAARELDRVMAGNPPWRDGFLATLPKFVRDARAPLRVMLALKNTPFPAKVQNQQIYLTLLLRNQAYDFAYHVWRQLLPRERSRTSELLYNGSFEFPPSGLPFDWSIVNGAGVTIDIVPHPDKDHSHALLIEYGEGRAGQHSVAEAVKLNAGAYRAVGQYRGELFGRRGLRWRMVCIDTHKAIGESEMAQGVVSDWKRFEFEFVVPPQGCPLQVLRLELDARSPSEWMVSGRMWYADLKIEPIGVIMRSAK